MLIKIHKIEGNKIKKMLKISKIVLNHSFLI
jgi:hypothetical protein